MKYFVKDLEHILQAKKVNIKTNSEITGVAIDSRKIKKGDLFIPFIGENVDGHNYIEMAFEKGASACLSLKDDLEFDNNIIYVEDSYKAIQDLAKHYLSTLKAKIVAITGSNGKTTTKDIISDILATKFKVHKTQGNLNNELGVPLTILATPEDSEILVVEMGADGFNQLNFLSKLAKPDYAVITNIGESHIEFFKTREGIARGKFEITEGLKKDGYFIYNGDEPLLRNLVEKSNINATSCGNNKDNNIVLENYETSRNYIDFKLNISTLQFRTTLKGKHNLLNIMYATAIALKLGLNDDEIKSAVENISSITNMRLESLQYGKNSLIINDAYNASPTSMKASVDVIEELNDFSYKTVVLGSMFELGPNENEYHAEVGKYINEHSNSINLVISVGDLAKNITDTVLNTEKLHFNSTDEVANYLQNNKHDNEVILFKASRGMKLETIIKTITKDNI